jgi:hypothetical protein
MSQLEGMPPDLEVFHDDCQRTVPLEQRAGLMAAIEAVGESGIIWVSALDRIGITDHLVDIVRMLPEGVTVKTKEGMDIRENELVSFCVGYIAKLEIKVKSDRQSNFAARARAEGLLDCPRSYGFNADRTVNPDEMRVLALVKTELEQKTPKTKIVRIVKEKLGIDIARQRIYDWKNGKHFERIPQEYMDEVRTKSDTKVLLQEVEELRREYIQKYSKNFPIGGKRGFAAQMQNMTLSEWKNPCSFEVLDGWLLGLWGIEDEDGVGWDREGLPESYTKHNNFDLQDVEVNMTEEYLNILGYEVVGWGPLKVVKA